MAEISYFIWRYDCMQSQRQMKEWLNLKLQKDTSYITSNERIVSFDGVTEFEVVITGGVSIFRTIFGDVRLLTGRSEQAPK